MIHAVVCAISLSFGTGEPPQAAAPDPRFVRAAADAIRYRFENDRFLISRIDLEIGSDGRGTLVFTRKGLAEPVRRPVVVGPEAMAELVGLLDRLDFVASTEIYQTKDDHSNLGRTVVAATRGGRSREVAFNYTENGAMSALSARLRGLATREVYAFDLETAARHQPLDTPELLRALKDDLKMRRVSDPKEMLPLLRELAEDPSLPLIARNRASELADLIERGRAR